MEKAYDLTWRQGIPMNLSEAEIEGRMLNFIQNFFKSRSFRVEVNEALSDTKVQTEDMPQGSVVSSTFFILKIKKIVAQFSSDNRFQTSHYMDYLQISYRHRDLRIVERSLKNSINVVEKIAQKNSFKFSTSKPSIYVTLYQTVELAFNRGSIRQH